MHYYSSSSSSSSSSPSSAAEENLEKGIPTTTATRPDLDISSLNYHSSLQEQENLLHTTPDGSSPRESIVALMSHKNKKRSDENDNSLLLPNASQQKPHHHRSKWLAVVVVLLLLCLVAVILAAMSSKNGASIFSTESSSRRRRDPTNYTITFPSLVPSAARRAPTGILTRFSLLVTPSSMILPNTILSTPPTNPTDEGPSPSSRFPSTSKPTMQRPTPLRPTHRHRHHQRSLQTSTTGLAVFLRGGESITSKGAIVSNGFQLQQELNGNLIVCANKAASSSQGCSSSNAMWQSNYQGEIRNDYSTRMQKSDGHLVTRRGGSTAVWSTGKTSTDANDYFLAYDGTRLTVYRGTPNNPGSVLWSSVPSSSSSGPTAPPPPAAAPSPPLPPPSSSPPPPPTRPPTTTTDISVTYVPGDLTVRQAGLRLSTGLKAEVIARTGQRVAYANGQSSDKKFHRLPDFGAVFPQGNGGGWIYVSNSEVGQNRGGVGAITFNKHGKVVDYKMLLTGTSMNCGGGPTPWATWVSCEETRGGRIWQVDPTGKRSPHRISVGSDGGGEFESFAYDKVKGEYFVTEDNAYGPLRRWIPAAGYNNANPWLTLHGAGETTYLRLMPESSNSGTYEWISNKKLASNNANAFYPNAEGIDVHGRRLYFVSKVTKTLFVLDLNSRRYTSHSTRKGLFDGQPDQLISVLTANNGNKDNDEELLYFTEDGGRLAGVHARNRQGKFYTILESEGSMSNDETTGLAFSPDYRFMYVAYQRTGKLFAISRQDGLPFTAKSLNVKYHAMNAM